MDRSQADTGARENQLRTRRLPQTSGESDMSLAADDAARGGQGTTQIGQGLSSPAARSTAEALAENVSRHEARGAERETLVEGLRPAALVSHPPLRAAVFLRTDKRGCGQLLALRSGTTRVGRSWEADARIDDAAVSRFHAQVTFDQGRYVIADLGSANGTYVNEHRVERAVLEDGSVVRLGSRVTLRFNIVEEDEKVALSRLHELGHHDPLTHVYNRRYLSQHLVAELAFAQRHQTAVSIVLLDIDHFKRVNDAHGHPAGDHVLERVAAIIAGQVRVEDVVARYGGEEFMLVLRETLVSGAEALAERIRKAVAEAVIEPPGCAAFQVTLSAGCASLECTGGVSVGELIQLADRRLYLAKSRGRNQVVGGGRCLASVPPAEIASIPPAPSLPSIASDPEPPSQVKPVEGLARAFENLPPDLRTIVGLHFQERCTFEEIAAIVDVTELQAREMFQAAMSRLRAGAA